MATLEAQVTELTERIAEKDAIISNHKTYQDQLYSQMEKYIEIIDYTMKLLYKLNQVTPSFLVPSPLQRVHKPFSSILLIQFMKA